MIIQGDMMAHNHSTKYICILREDSIDEGIPLYAKTKFSLQWTKKQILQVGFREHILYLLDIDIETEL